MKRALIAFASWEERFVSGCEVALAEFACDSVCVFYFDRFAELTDRNREVLGDGGRGWPVPKFVELGWRDPALAWRMVVDEIEELAGSVEELVLECSTMPREVIWYVLWAAEQRNTPVECRYFSPEDYGGDWISRDPLVPRMAFKISGIADPSKATALVVTVGFDPARVQRLVRWCEPTKLIVGEQVGERFRQNKKAMDTMRNILKKSYRDSVFFKVDAFGRDFGEDAIMGQVEDVLDSHNLVLASMGPRLGALALYRIQRRFSQTGLVCAPAGQYNTDYSIGSGSRYSSRMVWTRGT